MRNSAGTSGQTADAYPTSAPGPCSQFLVESELLIFYCCFVRYGFIFHFPFVALHVTDSFFILRE